MSRALRGRVDRNTPVVMRYSLGRRRALRGRVDRNASYLLSGAPEDGRALRGRVDRNCVAPQADADTRMSRPTRARG